MTDTKQKNTGRIMLVLTALLWGLAGVCVKSITWSSMAIIFARSLVSLILLIAVKGSFKINFSKINILAGVISISTGILYILALKMTNAGTAIVLQYVAPVFVFLYAVFFKKRKTYPLEILLVAFVFAGIVISFSDSLDATHVIGNVLALISGFTFAGQIILSNDKACEPEDAMIIAALLGTIISLPFFIFDGTVTFTFSNIFWILVLSIFQYGLANVLYAKGIHKIDSVEASLILTIEPIFNPIPVAIFCGEMMSGTAIIGAFMVIAGVTAFAIYQNKKQK